MTITATYRTDKRDGRVRFAGKDAESKYREWLARHREELQQITKLVRKVS